MAAVINNNPVPPRPFGALQAAAPRPAGSQPGAASGTGSNAFAGLLQQAREGLPANAGGAETQAANAPAAAGGPQQSSGDAPADGDGDDAMAPTKAPSATESEAAARKRTSTRTQPNALRPLRAKPFDAGHVTAATAKAPGGDAPPTSTEADGAAAGVGTDADVADAELAIDGAATAASATASLPPAAARPSAAATAAGAAGAEPLRGGVRGRDAVTPIDAAGGAGLDAREAAANRADERGAASASASAAKAEAPATTTALHASDLATLGLRRVEGMTALPLAERIAAAQAATTPASGVDALASTVMPLVPPTPSNVIATAPTATVDTGTLSASPGSDDFAPQLSARISSFVQAGVQHARLELNPTEMGPLTVQIRVDGQDAQVMLAADNAVTRQALEQSMPQLAAGLRDAGLTLTGGGVFDQPRQGNPDSSSTDQGRAPSGRGTGARSADDDLPVAAALSAGRSGAITRRGLVDLLA